MRKNLILIQLRRSSGLYTVSRDISSWQNSGETSTTNHCLWTRRRKM